MGQALLKSRNVLLPLQPKVLQILGSVDTYHQHVPPTVAHIPGQHALVEFRQEQDNAQGVTVALLQKQQLDLVAQLAVEHIPGQAVLAGDSLEVELAPDQTVLPIKKVIADAVVKLFMEIGARVLVVCKIGL